MIANWNVLTACAVLATTTPGIAAPTKLAFEKSDAVWVANIDGSGAKKIANGQSPALSPDGTRLAFNTVQAVGQPAHRKIAVADLATQQVKVFDEVPSDNCLQATWSHDGQRLLFYAYVENEMRIAVMNADGSDFKFIPNTGGEHQNYWSATWAHDGQSFFGQDMENLYQLSLDGSVMKKWPIEQLVPHGGMSGNVRLNISPDGKTLLLDVEMDEKERKGWDGPPPAIWTIDLQSEKATRQTPETLYAWDSNWCGEECVVFASQTAGEKNPSIYRMSLGTDGKDKKLLVKNATLPSAAQR
ncbi:MAG: translocation protein TolB [Chthoniobacterales bacterium]